MIFWLFLGVTSLSFLVLEKSYIKSLSFYAAAFVFLNAIVFGIGEIFVVDGISPLITVGSVGLSLVAFNSFLSHKLSM
jgi:hypothetical protein